MSDYIAGAVDVDATVVLPGVPDRPELPPPSRLDPTVLLAQRLEREKSTEVAIAAFAASGLPDRGWRLRIAGDGSHASALKHLADLLGISDATEFLGHRHDVEDLMATAAVLLAPCAIEGIGLSVIEAMASGLPVVAAAAGGHLESVGGVPIPALFAPGDHEAAAHHLVRLVEDPATLDAYGTVLRERQRRALTIAEQARATAEVYRHALVSRSPTPRAEARHGRGLVVSLEPWGRAREAADTRLTVVDRERFPQAIAAGLPATDRFPTGADPQVPTWADRVDEMSQALRRVSTGPGPGRADVPLQVRTRFGHAAVQRLADEHAIDLLHIKGDALDTSVIRPGRIATDADVLVRPAHLDALL